MKSGVDRYVSHLHQKSFLKLHFPYEWDSVSISLMCDIEENPGPFQECYDAGYDGSDELEPYTRPPLPRILDARAREEVLRHFCEPFEEDIVRLNYNLVMLSNDEDEMPGLAPTTPECIEDESIYEEEDFIFELEDFDEPEEYPLDNNLEFSPEGGEEYSTGEDDSGESSCSCPQWWKDLITYAFASNSCCSKRGYTKPRVKNTALNFALCYKKHVFQSELKFVFNRYGSNIFYVTALFRYGCINYDSFAYKSLITARYRGVFVTDQHDIVIEEMNKMFELGNNRFPDLGYKPNKRYCMLKLINDIEPNPGPPDSRSVFAILNFDRQGTIRTVHSLLLGAVTVPGSGIASQTIVPIGNYFSVLSIPTATFTYIFAVRNGRVDLGDYIVSFAPLVQQSDGLPYYFLRHPRDIPLTDLPPEEAFAWLDENQALGPEIGSERSIFDVIKDPLNMGAVTKSSDDIVSSLSSKLDEVVHVGKGLQSYVDKIIEVVTKVCDDGKIQVSHSVDLLPKFINGDIDDELTIVLTFLGLTATTYIVTNKILKMFLGTATLGFVIKFGDRCSRLKELLSYIPLVFSEGVDSTGPEGPTIMGSKSDQLINAILGYQYFRVFKDCSQKDNVISEFLKGIAKFGRAKEGLISFVDFIIDVTYGFVRFLGDKINIDSWKTLGLSYPRVSHLCKEVNEFICKMDRHPDFGSTDAYNYLRGVVQEIRALKVDIPIHKDNIIYHNTLMTLLKLVEPLLCNFARNNVGADGFRTGPLTFLLLGPPGHGKSVAMDMLTSDLGIELAPQPIRERMMRNFDDCVFNVQTESEFFEGYHGQFCVRCDEFGQAVDVAGTPDSCAFILIRMSNTAKYTLNMAHLDLKGNNVFDSRILACTCNLYQWLFKSIHEPKAVDRRFHFKLLLLLKKEFRIQTGENIYDCVANEELLSKHIVIEEYFDHNTNTVKTVEAWSTDVWEFIPWDMNVGKAVGSPLSYDEVFELCKKKFHKINENGVIMRNMYVARRHARYKEKTGKDYTPEIGYCSADLNWLSAQLGLTRDCIIDCLDYVDDVTTCEILRVFKERYIKPVKFGLTTIYDSMLNFVKNNPITCTLVSLGIFSTFWFLLKSNIDEPESGLIKSKTRVVKKTSKVIAKGHKVTKTAAVLEPEMALMDDNARQVIAKVKNNNWFSAVLSREGYTRNMGFFLFIYGRVAVSPKHFYDACIDNLALDEKSTLTLTCVGRPKLIYTFFLKDVLPDDIDEFSDRGICPGQSIDGEAVAFEEDLWFWQFNETMPRRKDIRDLFTNMFDASISRPFGGAFLQADDKGSIETVILPVKPISSKDYGYTLNRGFMSNQKSGVGMCGSLLFNIDSFTKKTRIVGMHVAGNKVNAALSVGLFSEYIEVVEEYFESEMDLPYEEDCEEEMGQLNEYFDIVKKYSSTIANPYHTQLKRTELYGSIGPSNNIPAILHPYEKDGIKVDPLRESICGYGSSLPPLSCELLKKTVNATFNSMSKECFAKDEFVPCEVLTIDQAITGWYDLKGVNLNGAVGLEFHSLGFKKKRDMVGSPDGYDLSKPGYKILRDKVEKSIFELKNGVRPSWIARIFPKDELLDRDKVLNKAKLRSIWGNPFDMSVVGRMYFGAFMAAMARDRIKNNFAVGMNVNSDEFDTLGKCLTRFGPNRNIFGDYKKYDSNHRLLVARYNVLYYINPWYRRHMSSTEEEDNIRLRYVECVCGCMFYYQGLVYFIYDIMPSGDILTTTLNNLRNETETIYCAYTIHTGNCFNVDTSVLQELVEKVERKFYGDDNSLAIHRSLNMSMIDFTEGFGKMGYIYTSDLKDDTVFQYRDLLSGSFLKCKFVICPKYKKYVSQLSMQSIMDMIYYRNKGCSIDDYKRNIRCAILHLTRHGKCIFDSVVPKLLRLAYGEVGFVLDIPDNYEDCYDASFYVKSEYV